MLLYSFFFFSSRRRHTRLQGDWSSDVCSSDLEDRPADRLEGRDTITREAALLGVGYAFGFSLLAFEMGMSLAHKWVSSLYGAVYFLGSFLAALMALAALVVFGCRR